MDDRENKLSHRLELTMRMCPRCNVLKTLSDFAKSAARGNGRQFWCRACVCENSHAKYIANREEILARSKAMHRAHPEKKRAAWRKRAYGLSPEQFSEMITSQGGCCAMCATPFGKKIYVDHNHATGAVRGLLCNKCNIGLGYYEQPDFAVALDTYLSRPMLRLVAQ